MVSAFQPSRGRTGLGLAIETSREAARRTQVELAFFGGHRQNQKRKSRDSRPQRSSSFRLGWFATATAHAMFRPVPNPPVRCGEGRAATCKWAAECCDSHVVILVGAGGNLSLPSLALF